MRFILNDLWLLKVGLMYNKVKLDLSKPLMLAQETRLFFKKQRNLGLLVKEM